MRTVLRLSPLVRAAHPLPAAAVTVLAGLVVVALGAGPAAAALATASTLGGQLSIGWSNDYLDREEDAAAGRRDKPIPGGEVRASAVWRSALVALPASVALSVPLGMGEVAVMAAAVGSAWGYNLGLKRTVLSWVPYAVAFGLAPVYLWLAAGAGPAPGWVVAAGALLGLGGHLTNVLPDLEADRAGGARGLPHRLRARGSLVGAGAALAVSLGLVLAFRGPLEAPALAAAGTAAILIVGLMAAGLVGRSRLAFRLTIAAAGAVVGTLLLAGVR